MDSLRTSFRRLALATLPVAVWLAVTGATAHAAFPGLNGKIAFNRETNIPTKITSARGLPSSSWTRARAGLRSQRLLRGTDQIWTINPDGSAPLNISSSSRLDAEAAWSADGTKIAFSAEQPNTISEIWVMNADGSGQTDLTNDPNTNDFSPAWSPDGTQIVYTHEDATSGLGQIWVMNADGSNKHQLVPSVANADDGDAVWSPDGTRIAFDRSVNDQQQIYVANADGSGATNVSNNSDYDSQPNWSPDGSKLAFAKIVSSSGTGDSQIWVMNSDGSSPHFLTNPDTGSNVPGAHFDNAPAFSPDGTLVTYEREEGNLAPVPFQFTVWEIGADASNPHQVSAPDNSSADFLPDWQPVGSPVSAATFPTGCTATASVVVHVADPTRFISPLGVHYKVDGGAEQGVAADGAGNVTIPVPNGTHTVEYWASDAAGYLEATHHTGTLSVDAVNNCAPKLGVAGVRRACVAKTFRIRVNVSTIGAPKSVRVFLGKKRIVTTTKTSFTLKINPKKLAHRTRLRIVATSATGQVTTISRTVTRCAVAKPRRHAAPRFTG